MNLLCIDLGSYSVKFAEYSLARKNIVLIQFQELSLAEARMQFDEDISNNQLKLEIVRAFIKDHGSDLKVIFQVPNEMITARFLHLPVIQRKKVEAMIPFQLDDNLPFPLEKIIYRFTLEKEGKGSFAQVAIAEREAFAKFFGLLDTKQCMPSLLTTELSINNSFVNERADHSSYLIIDLGHSLTKGYAVEEKRIVANHLSHTASRQIDTIIAKTYGISNQEAVNYKHEQAFIFTESQYEDADGEQAEFSLLMKQTLAPLVLDIRRWIIGHRAKFGNPILKIYLTGGGSKLNNIIPFLSEELSINIERLELNHGQLRADNEFSQDPSYHFCYTQALAQNATIRPLNFLTGEFSSRSNQGFPLYSTGFLLVRTSILAASIVFLLLLQNMIISGSTKKLTKKLATMSKNPNLKLTRSDKNKLRRKPDLFLKVLQKKNKDLNSHIKQLKALGKVNAVETLFKLNSLVSGSDNYFLQKFVSEQGLTTATFSGNQIDQLESLKTVLDGLTLNNKGLELNRKSKTIQLVFEE